MFRRDFKTQLKRKLKKNPGYIYVENTFIAVLMPDETILVIPGDFENATAESANTRLQEVLAKMQ